MPLTTAAAGAADGDADTAGRRSTGDRHNGDGTASATAAARAADGDV